MERETGMSAAPVTGSGKGSDGSAAIAMVERTNKNGYGKAPYP